MFPNNLCRSLSIKDELIISMLLGVTGCGSDFAGLSSFTPFSLVPLSNSTGVCPTSSTCFDCVSASVIDSATIGVFSSGYFLDETYSFLLFAVSFSTPEPPFVRSP